MTWSSIRPKFVKKTRMLNPVESLGYIKCYSLNSPRPIKSPINSITYNCQKICSWSRRPKPYWKSDKMFYFYSWPTILNNPGLDKLCARWRACMQRARKEVFLCTKSHARKLVKTFLTSTPTLFKVVSYFCVWKQLIFGTIRSDIRNLFYLRSCCWIWLYLVYVSMCSSCENNSNSNNLKLILNCMWFWLLHGVKDLQYIAVPCEW